MPRNFPDRSRTFMGATAGLLAIGLVAAVSLPAAADVVADSGPVAGGTTVTVDVPVAYPEIVDVEVGGRSSSFSIALDAEGNVWTWGSYVLGIDYTYGDVALVEPTWGSRTIVQISHVFQHSLALASDGTVWAWGGNLNGELGDGTTTPTQSPVQVTPAWGSQPITQISAGNSGSMALAADGTVWTWGTNNSGGLGTGVDESVRTGSAVPVEVNAPWGAQPIIHISSGQWNGAVVASDGTIWAWGANDWPASANSPGYNLGTGSTSDDVLVPEQVLTDAWGSRTITSVHMSLGGENMTALASDGTAWLWGYTVGNPGQSNGELVMPARQITSASLGSRTFTQVTSSSGVGLGLASDGTVWGWGKNAHVADYPGNWGPEPVLASYEVPVQIDSAPWGDRTIVQVVSNTYSSMVVASDGTVWAWGDNDQGQLGFGTMDKNDLSVVPGPARSLWAPVSVAFDGILGTDFIDNGDGTVTVTTPPHPAGAVDVTVQWRLRSATDTTGPAYTDELGFTYIAPDCVADADSISVVYSTQNNPDAPLDGSYIVHDRVDVGRSDMTLVYTIEKPCVTYPMPVLSYAGDWTLGDADADTYALFDFVFGATTPEIAADNELQLAAMNALIASSPDCVDRSVANFETCLRPIIEEWGNSIPVGITGTVTASVRSATPGEGSLTFSLEQKDTGQALSAVGSTPYSVTRPTLAFDGEGAFCSATLEPYQDSTHSYAPTGFVRTPLTLTAVASETGVESDDATDILVDSAGLTYSVNSQSFATVEGVREYLADQVAGTYSVSAHYVAPDGVPALDPSPVDVTVLGKADADCFRGSVLPPLVSNPGTKPLASTGYDTSSFPALAGGVLLLLVVGGCLVVRASRRQSI